MPHHEKGKQDDGGRPSLAEEEMDGEAKSPLQKSSGDKRRRVYSWVTASGREGTGGKDK